MVRTKNISVVFISLIPLLAGCNSPYNSNVDIVMSTTFEHPLFGLTISKPDSWKIVSFDEHRMRISSTKLKDENIEKLVLLFASRPIVSLLKSRWKIPLPNVQITVNPLDGDMNNLPTDILRRVSKMGPVSFKNYSIINYPSEIEIDGHKAAYMKAHYTGQFWDDNKEYPISYETWIILRHEYFFMISAVSSQNEDSTTLREISSIIESIKLK